MKSTIDERLKLRKWNNPGIDAGVGSDLRVPGDNFVIYGNYGQE
jgi:hypothetical protein